jgi:cytochrome c-type biogenesis protein CcmH/NrfF/ribosomal protein L40E
MSESKTCTSCQAENDFSAKFCFNCGSELVSQTPPKGSCQSCGFENPEDAKFCASCGAALEGKSTVSPPPSSKDPPKESMTFREKPAAQQKKKGKRKHKSPARQNFPKRRQAAKKWNPATIAVVAIGALLVIFYFVYMNQRAAKISEPYVEQKTENLELENKVLAVASKFVCACGSCPKEPLETCSCPTAGKERDFIRNALYSGMDEDNVITTLNNRYGGIESEYESQYGSGKVNLTLPPSPGQNLPLDLPGDTENASQLASFANRIEIISHFACPCGQCDRDELIECDCEHPRGAKEVKRFIDEKISEGNLTLGQVIEFVENKYGGKIR